MPTWETYRRYRWDVTRQCQEKLISGCCLVQNEKKMQLTQQETNKIKERDDQHTQELREWRSDLAKRKQVNVTDWRLCLLLEIFQLADFRGWISTAAWGTGKLLLSRQASAKTIACLCISAWRFVGVSPILLTNQISKWHSSTAGGFWGLCWRIPGWCCPWITLPHWNS